MKYKGKSIRNTPYIDRVVQSTYFTLYYLPRQRQFRDDLESWLASQVDHRWSQEEDNSGIPVPVTWIAKLETRGHPQSWGKSHFIPKSRTDLLLIFAAPLTRILNSQPIIEP